MTTLGISGHDRDAAAALSIDGRVVAAAAEESFARVAGIGYAHTGGLPLAAVDACLIAAGLDVSDIDEVVVVGEAWDAGGLGKSVRVMSAAEADARHAAASSPSSGTVLVCGINPPVLALFPRAGDGVGSPREVAGANSLFAAAADLASVLGLRPEDALAELDRTGADAAPEYAKDFDSLISFDGPSVAVSVDPRTVVAAAKRIAGEHADALGNPKSLNAKAQQKRRALAASFTTSLAGVVANVANLSGAGDAPESVAAGGSAFGNAGFNSALRKLVGSRLALAAVPEPSGRVLGAVTRPALAGTALALGPAYSEEAIKRTLDNCRLDYVYEPDWARLLARVSKMLANGKVVGWFQGPMAFGPRPLGTRSILADPSNRYARQNMNEYLRDLPLDTTLPLAIAPSMAEVCVAGDAQSIGSRDVVIRTEWRAAFAAALDANQSARIHAPARQFEPRFRDLLEHHHAATGTPGLMEIGLAGAGEPIACTPRDAVRTLYSSAIDALVIGRFLLMKDYWLLRSQE